MATQVSGVNRWLTLNGEPLRFHPVSENLAAGAEEYGYNNLRLTRSAPDGLTIWVDGEQLETEIYGRWTWRPRGFAGLYELGVSAPGHGRHQTQVRVLPSLFSQQRHEWMLQEIAKFSLDLLLRLQSPATEWMSVDDLEESQSPLRSYRLIEQLMAELGTAMRQIELMPHQALVSQSERRQWHEVRDYSAEVTPVAGPTVALPQLRARLPEAWPLQWDVSSHALTYDVYENRLLKQFLWRQLLIRISDVAERAGQEIQRRRSDLAIKQRRGWEDDESGRIAELEAVVVRCKEMERQVLAWGSLPFLQYVRPRTQRTVPTQVLQKHPAYGRFYQLYLLFQRKLRRGLNVDGFLTRIALRKMSELYEMWAVFRMTNLLMFALGKAGFRIISSQGFYRLEDAYFHFEVDRGAEIALLKGDRRLAIRYEPTYPPMGLLPTGLVTARRYQRTPDLALEVWRGGEVEHVLIFDAKYKVEKVAGRETFVQDDVQKMSSYYSEIAWKERDPRRRPRPVVSSAYILYPGEVVEHDTDYIQVGALPFVPGPKQQDAVMPALVDLLRFAELL